MRKRHSGIKVGYRAPDAPVRGLSDQPVRLFELFKGPHWTLLGDQVDRLSFPASPNLQALQLRRRRRSRGSCGPFSRRRMAFEPASGRSFGRTAISARLSPPARSPSSKATCVRSASPGRSDVAARPLTLRGWATPLIIGAFILMAGTGVVIFFKFDNGLMAPIHRLFSWVFLLGRHQSYRRQHPSLRQPSEVGDRQNKRRRFRCCPLRIILFVGPGDEPKAHQADRDRDPWRLTRHAGPDAAYRARCSGLSAATTKSYGQGGPICPRHCGRKPGQRRPLARDHLPHRIACGLAADRQLSTAITRDQCDLRRHCGSDRHRHG